MKKLLGIVFLVAAATVVYFGSVGWPSLDVNLWSLIPVGLFLFFTLENLLKKDYKASLMCLIIAFIIANAILDLLPISSGLVIGAGVLACVGIGYLFPDKEGKLNLRKSLQPRPAAVYMLLTSSVLSTISKQCFELTSSILSTT
ncbi:S1 RNA-binding domain-containing protein [Streptococcus pneumoniae]|nr:S1 RNA-binding domain-containing protein [Streptococcus pneumoniae]